MSRFETHIDIDAAGQSAVALLSDQTDLGRQVIKQAMSKGAVWLTGRHGTQRIRRADKALSAGDRLHMYYDPSILAQQPPAATLIADEQAFSIWSKPCGMFSQGSRWGDHCTIGRWAEKHLQPQRPAFITHRLDRAASGLIIIAHAKGTAAAIAKLFREHRISKTYTAIVHGRLAEAMTIDQPIDNKAAVTQVRCREYDAERNLSVLEVAIESGRKHQIRRHLAEAGLPIVGDRLHGCAPEDTAQDLCLASSGLAFESPLDGPQKRYVLPTELLPWRMIPESAP